MKMKIEETIAGIHAGDIYGIFIESGCGLALTNKLFEISGASNTVYVAESPYSKQFQQAKYGHHEKRMVSTETICDVMQYYSDPGRRAMEMYSDLINSIYVANFQIGDKDNDISTHGYIGFIYKGKSRIYHISVHDRLSRKEYLDVIGNIGVRILESKNNYIPPDCHIDAAYVYEDDFGKKDMDLTDMIASLPDSSITELIDMLGNSTLENFICIDTDGTYARLEDFFRGKKHILIYKGSFDPPHLGHIGLAEMAEERYGERPVLLISKQTYGKDEVDDMKLRVGYLNEIGYRVIISKSGFFNDNIEYIRKKFPASPIVFVAGTDTVNRIFESSYKVIGNSNPYPDISRFKADFENVRFFVASREGFPLAKELVWLTDYDYISYNCMTSSTEIRNLKLSGDLEKIKKLMPSELHEKYLSK